MSDDSRIVVSSDTPERYGWDVSDQSDVESHIADDEIGLPFEYGFDSLEDMTEFILGNDDSRAYHLTEEDKDEQLNLMYQFAGFRCPSCLDDIESMLDDADSDSYCETIDGTEEKNGYQRDDGEKLYRGVYCPEHNDDTRLLFRMDVDDYLEFLSEVEKFDGR